MSPAIVQWVANGVRRLVSKKRTVKYDAALADVRGRDALAEHGDDLEAIDPGALARAERALAGVRAGVEQHVAPVDLKEAVAVARAPMGPLVRSSAHE